MTSKNPDFTRFVSTCQQRIEAALDAVLPTTQTYPDLLHETMRYATLNGGKRIRPLLVYGAGQALRADETALDAAACAVECIHAYSLVHDDLPAMDDDALRRGKPSCHAAFGEAQAILAGDALQTLAFHILAHADMGGLSAERRLEMVELLAGAAGSRGMVGGQSVDLAAVGRELTLPELENMHIHKTGALIRIAVLLGVLCSTEYSDAERKALDHYGKYIGLAFQVQDDILDVVGETSELGKQAGADRALNKPTYPALLGLQGARERARELQQSALASLEVLDRRADPLRQLAEYIIDRGT
ncbi:MAG: (2E,6E)-farnesyl diphosphate synthase [Thiogranum sp.]|nr:(2E,6E)-farnesyl diphosphate synthase [Thiogranum sp.]